MRNNDFRKLWDAYWLLYNFKVGLFIDEGNTLRYEVLDGICSILFSFLMRYERLR